MSVDLFERFLNRQDGKMTVMYRGSDRANVAGEKKDNGITAQMDETERLEHAHCQRISDACQSGIDRKVIRYCFGEGIEPLAYFGLPDMEADDASQVRESAGFLADRGVLVDAADIADRLGVTLTQDEAEALTAIGGMPTEDGETKAADRLQTANAGKTKGSAGILPVTAGIPAREAKAARLEQLIEQALRTANTDPFRTANASPECSEMVTPNAVTLSERPADGISFRPSGSSRRRIIGIGKSSD